MCDWYAALKNISLLQRSQMIWKHQILLWSELEVTLDVLVMYMYFRKVEENSWKQIQPLRMHDCMETMV